MSVVTMKGTLVCTKQLDTQVWKSWISVPFLKNKLPPGNWTGSMLSPLLNIQMWIKQLDQEYKSLLKLRMYHQETRKCLCG